MYEKPRLIHVGAANSVIRGITMFGVDPDTHDFPFELEFAADSGEEPGDSLA